MEKWLIGCVRKKAGRPLDQSSDVITNVEGLRVWERREGQLRSRKTQERVDEMDQISPTEPSLKQSYLNIYHPQRPW